MKTFILLLTSVVVGLAQVNPGIQNDRTTKHVTNPQGFWAAQPSDDSFVAAVRQSQTNGVGGGGGGSGLDQTNILIANIVDRAQLTNWSKVTTGSMASASQLLNSTNALDTALRAALASYYLASNPSNYVTQTVTNGLATIARLTTSTNDLDTQLRTAISTATNGHVTQTVTNGLATINRLTSATNDLDTALRSALSAYYLASNPSGYVTQTVTNGLADAILAVATNNDTATRISATNNSGVTVNLTAQIANGLTSGATTTNITVDLRNGQQLKFKLPPTGSGDYNIGARGANLTITNTVDGTCLQFADGVIVRLNDTQVITLKASDGSVAATSFSGIGTGLTALSGSEVNGNVGSADRAFSLADPDAGIAVTVNTPGNGGQISAQPFYLYAGSGSGLSNITATGLAITNFTGYVQGNGVIHFLRDDGAELFLFDTNGTLTASSFSGQLSANQLASGTIPAARSGTLGAIAGPMLTTNAGNFAVSYNGNALTNLPAQTNANTALLDRVSQVFTQTNTFKGLAITTPATAAGAAMVVYESDGGLGTNAMPVATSRTITLAVGSASLTTSAGAQDLSANRTWTLDTAQNIQTTATPQFSSLGLGAAAPGGNGVTALGSIISATTIIGTNGFFTPTNTWTVDTAVPFPTVTTKSSGTATFGIPAITLPSTGGSRAQATIMIISTGTVTFTNAVGFHASDLLTSRTIASGYYATVEIDLWPGVSTNIFITQTK